MSRWVAVLLAIGCVTLSLAACAFAAAPNYILVNGRGVPHPVLLANWQQNLELLAAVGNSPSVNVGAVASLASRPHFDLAEYWAWGGRPRPTSPAQASQHGQFYPAHGSRRAVVVMQVQGMMIPRLAPALFLKVLAHRGVPVRA